MPLSFEKPAPRAPSPVLHRCVTCNRWVGTGKDVDGLERLLTYPETGPNRNLRGERICRRCYIELLGSPA